MCSTSLSTYTFKVKYTANMIKIPKLPISSSSSSSFCFSNSLPQNWHSCTITIMPEPWIYVHMHSRRGNHISLTQMKNLPPSLPLTNLTSFNIFIWKCFCFPPRSYHRGTSIEISNVCDDHFWRTFFIIVARGSIYSNRTNRDGIDTWWISISCTIILISSISISKYKNRPLSFTTLNEMMN